MNQYPELETALQNQFQRLGNEFSKLLDENKIKINLTYGAWVNENGVGVGWLSCLKDDPSKEALELTVDFHVNNIETIMNCGIYWTDGRFVEDFGDFDIGSSNDIVGMIDKIIKTVNKIEDVILSRYLFRLIENLHHL